MSTVEACRSQSRAREAKRLLRLAFNSLIAGLPGKVGEIHVEAGPNQSVVTLPTSILCDLLNENYIEALPYLREKR